VRLCVEDELQTEIDALREKVRSKEEEWVGRLDTESAARHSAEVRRCKLTPGRPCLVSVMNR